MGKGRGNQSLQKALGVPHSYIDEDDFGNFTWEEVEMPWNPSNKGDMGGICWVV